MAFSTGDLVTVASRATVDQAKAYLRTDSSFMKFTLDYLNELYRLCQKFKIDFAFAFAQFCDETARGTSWAWYNEGNPAGIGIFPDGSRESMKYKTGVDAARAHVVHLYAYIYGAVPKGSELESYLALDPRYDNVFSAGFAGSTKRIGDFGNGKWATNPKYAQQIVGHANAAFPNAPSPSGDNMATPKIIDKYLHVAQDGYPAVNRRYIGANKRKIIVLHIQEGTNWGSWQHFHSVSASSTVLIGRNGDIWRLVPESDGPWTNGDVCSPTAVGQRVRNAYGSDPNYYSLTIETEGFATSNNALGWLAWPKPQAQLDSVVWQIKDWMNRYDIPIENVIRHADINMCSRPGCPGNEFYNYVINRIKNEGTDVEQPKPVYASVSPVLDKDGNKWDGSKDLQVNTALFRAEKRTVKANAGVTFRAYATTKAGITRDTMEAGKGFAVLGWVNGEEVKGERRWWITKGYSRVHVSGTVEKPTEKPVPLPDEDTDPPQPDEKPEVIEYGPTIVNGRAYYPLSLFLSAENDDDEQEAVSEMKVIVTEDEAPARRTVKVKAPVHHTFKKGDELIVTHFVVGDKVDGEELWWVVKPDNDRNPLHHGLRVPVAYTNVRPS